MSAELKGNDWMDEFASARVRSRHQVILTREHFANRT